MFRFPEPLLVQKPEDEVMTARLEPRRQETEVSYVMSVSVRYMVHWGTHELRHRVPRFDDLLGFRVPSRKRYLIGIDLPEQIGRAHV